MPHGSNDEDEDHGWWVEAPVLGSRSQVTLNMDRVESIELIYDPHLRPTGTLVTMRSGVQHRTAIDYAKLSADFRKDWNDAPA